MSDIIKIAIISDLHCRFGKDSVNSVTRLHTDMPRKPEIKHPVSALINLIRAEDISVDAVLCPGDITDKADDQGMLSGWAFLKEIQRAFRAPNLLATVGNHDVKSRSTTDTSFDFLKNFDNEYPLGNDTANNEFWANSFTVINYESVSILVYNSCYSHTDAEKAKTCNISPATLEAIEEKIKNLEDNVFKIALSHHHPLKHANKDYNDGDVMDKGDKLINLLVKYNFNVLVHGHKHEPRLTIYDSLPILASGSFSSRENLLDSASENVFHLITLENGPNRGQIITYIYNPNKGWLINRGESFPSHTGFGARMNIDTLITECGNWFSEIDSRFVGYNEVLEKFPDLAYLTPQDQKNLQEKFRSVYHFEFLPCLEDGAKYFFKMV